MNKALLLFLLPALILLGCQNEFATVTTRHVEPTKWYGKYWFADGTVETSAGSGTQIFYVRYKTKCGDVEQRWFRTPYDASKGLYNNPREVISWVIGQDRDSVFNEQKGGNPIKPLTEEVYDIQPPTQFM